MTDQHVREPMPPDPERDRTDVDAGNESAELTRPPIRPSMAEGAEEDAGPRSPRPSQAEGEREGRDPGGD
jgi:hypothetical protein